MPVDSSISWFPLLRKMEEFRKDKPGDNVSKQTHDQRDLATQAIISCALGLGAFIAFCVSCNWRPLQMLYADWSMSERSYDRDGKLYTQHARDKGVQHQNYRIYPIRFLDGFLYCIM